MFFNNPIPRSGLPKLHEASPQRSFRDSDAVPRLWQKGRTSTEQLYKTCQAVEQLQRQLNRLRLRKGDVTPAVTSKHPFKVYKSPTNPAWTDDEKSSETPTVNKAWRTFRVRAGAVGAVDVAGTDGDGTVTFMGGPVSTNIDPDRQGVPVWISATVDFTVTSGEEWYVWVDCTDTAAPFIDYGPTADVPAEGFWQALYVLVATIDCDTYEADMKAVVRQYRREDIPLAQQCVAGVAGEFPI